MCKHKYFKNNKKQITKKKHSQSIQIRNIAMENFITTKTLKEFFYRSIIISNNKKNEKLDNEKNKNINEILINDEL